jgi:hypothetical protein
VWWGATRQQSSGWNARLAFQSPEECVVSNFANRWTKHFRARKGGSRRKREVEKGLSPVADEKYAISFYGDAKWDKRSSGRNYSSLSGCSGALGCRLQLAWDIEPMSNNCIKCVRKVVHDDDVCAKNVTCSVEAIEAVGLARLVNRVCSLGDCFVSESVGDDDSSTKKVMQHLYADMLRLGKINEWPRYTSKDEKKKEPRNQTTGSYLSPIQK